ncbi:MAG: B12-binding domain-containing radical SAM protein [Nitrospinota bacterium]|nr:B12-binding domain-containing radical SAM protein [Nitrospinota bacterium]
MKIAVLEPCLSKKKNIVRDVVYGCWCGGKRIGGATVPPYEQLRIATILKADGHDVVFVDAQAEGLSSEEALSRIMGARLVISSSSVMTINQDATFLMAIKQKMPDTLFTIYGSHSTFRPADTLAKGIDFAIRREPEGVVRALAMALDKGDMDAAKAVKGLAYMNGGGAVVNEHHPFIEDLDNLPPLDVTMLPKGVDYFNPIVRRLPYITTSSSQGCPAKCVYCTAPFFHGTKVRMQSAQKVVADMKFYLENGIREIYFRDETFTANRERVIEICEGILAEGLDVTWIANARVDTVDHEMLALMKKAGCHLLKFGVESGNQVVLDASSKGVTLEQSEKAFADCARAGMDTHAHFMIGMPGETEQTLQDTLAFALKIDPTTVTFGLCSPYPGTPLFKKVFNFDPAIGDGSDNADIEKLHLEAGYNHLYCDVGSERLETQLRVFYRKFYMRPRYLLKMLRRIGDGAMLRNAVIGGLNVLSFASSRKAG